MKTGFVGSGLMGAPMARRLLDAGNELGVYNRTPARAAGLVASGAHQYQSSETLLIDCDVVVVMVSDAAAVREALLNDDCKPYIADTTIIQMSTIGPNESIEIASEIEAAGGVFLEAPVLGSIPQATDGSLIVMVGGDDVAFVQQRPLLEHFGPKPRLIGSVGAASALKLALNQLIASLTGAFALSLGAVVRSGVNPTVFMEILRTSALYAPTFDKKLEGMLEDRFTPANFPARLLLKDTRLFLGLAERLNLDPAALKGLEKTLEHTLALGHSDSDYSALAKAVWRGEPVGG
jgi:3-hydroxyisobutyrate dehydrogenase